jgi:hypothetical protein
MPKMRQVLSMQVPRGKLLAVAGYRWQQEQRSSSFCFSFEQHSGVGRVPSEEE